LSTGLYRNSDSRAAAQRLIAPRKATEIIEMATYTILDYRQGDLPRQRRPPCGANLNDTQAGCRCSAGYGWVVWRCDPDQRQPAPTTRSSPQRSPAFIRSAPPFPPSDRLPDPLRHPGERWKPRR
jgi:hypothetical protein